MAAHDRDQLLGPANLTWCVARQDDRPPRRPRGSCRPGGQCRLARGLPRRARPRHPAYGASKAGLHAFGQSMAQRLAPHGIAVTSLAPGFIETEMAGDALGRAGGSTRRRARSTRRPARGGAGRRRHLRVARRRVGIGGVVDFNGASHLR